MVERKIGLPIRSGVGDNPKEGSNPHTMQMQNPVPAEILNRNSPGGERPFRRTPLMRRIEALHDGAPIGSILEDLYLCQKKSPRQIKDEIGPPPSRVTISNWLNLIEVTKRSLGDGVRVWHEQKKPRKILAAKDSPTKNKLMDVKETFGIDSEKKFKSFLIKMYKKHHSLEAMAKAFGEENGIDVSSITVGNWMSQFEIDVNVLREKDNRNLVRRSVRSGDFEKLTPPQKEVLERRGFFRKGLLTPFRKLPEDQSRAITFQTACKHEIAALKKLRRLKYARSKMAQARVLRRPVGRPRKPLVA